jgi:hypothetical protein
MIYLTVKVNPGVHVDDAVLAGYDLAEKLGIDVEVIHNERSFMCYSDHETGETEAAR